MNKYILYIAVIPISVIIGKIFVIKYKEKRIFFEDFLIFLKAIEKEVAFTSGTVKEVIAHFSNDGRFINEVKASLYTKDKPNLNNLTDGQKAVFNGFINTLGKTDRITQKQIIIEVKNSVQQFISDAEKEEKRNKNLYFKLSLFLGILIYILLI